MDCIFCKTVKGEMPSTKVFESANVVGIFDIHPTNKGHTLVMPKMHYESLLDVPSDLLKELFEGVQKVGAAMVKGLGVSGFNVIVNNGKVAGQLIPHLHVHVIPRTLEDNLQHWPGGRYRDNEAEEYAEKIRGPSVNVLSFSSILSSPRKRGSICQVLRNSRVYTYLRVNAMALSI